ncbi:uncharacterized protein LOC126902387 isoform X2 [Daktulosphaira vitifoliae]|uniref:uncharacterized protein LOC126902387 isoform X2 n=1 Tax=Daktulosphaira vitifoliae TaxID=58002 RepID=UPI0021A99F7B|nr:uncharacterized protein LOC126902387 isoform X2 [Daktulosphaira vitifoliae]
MFESFSLNKLYFLPVYLLFEFLSINEEIKLTGKDIELILQKHNEVLKTLEELEIRVNNLDPQFTTSKNLTSSLSKEQVPVTNNDKVAIRQYVKLSPSEINKKLEQLTKTDTVIFADPKDPPYSLLAFPFLWPSICWDISYHVHSTLTMDCKKVLGILNMFKNFQSKNITKISVKLIVIWKNVKLGTTIIRSPSNSFIGEVSLLRLFYQYLATESLFIIDQVNFDKEMDLIHSIKFSSDDRLSELCNLIDPTSLKLDIGKVAIWSLLNNKKEKCPKSIEKWFEKITKMILS